VGNSVPTVLGDRYDAFSWFDQSQALHPAAHPARRRVRAGNLSLRGLTDTT
jgi:hypothetical protein